MKLATAATLVVLALSTSACVMIDADDKNPNVSVSISDAGVGELETVKGVSIERDALVVRVASNGCTKVEDFTVDSSTREGLTTLTLKRKRPDLCRALLAEGVDLRFPLDPYGVDRGGKVRVRNPLARP